MHRIARKILWLVVVFLVVSMLGCSVRPEIVRREQALTAAPEPQNQIAGIEETVVEPPPPTPVAAPPPAAAEEISTEQQNRLPAAVEEDVTAAVPQPTAPQPIARSIPISPQYRQHRTLLPTSSTQSVPSRHTADKGLSNVSVPSVVPPVTPTESVAVTPHPPQSVNTTSAELLTGTVPIPPMLLFCTGVGLLILVLVITIFIPRPVGFQAITFRTTLALAAASIAASIPGFIELKTKVLNAGALQGGGAISVFLLVYFFNPKKFRR